MSEIKPNKMKIVILGDTGVGKTTLINSYLQIKEDNNNMDNQLAQNNKYKKIEKLIHNRKYILDFYEFNFKNDKMIYNIQSAKAVIIIIDLNNRSSFDNLNEYWLRFLRDDCFYLNLVYIFGNYFDKSSTALTATEEITDMIDKSGITAKYIEIGHKQNDDLNAVIDQLIQSTEEDDMKKLKSSKSKGESFKNCLIY